MSEPDLPLLSADLSSNGVRDIRSLKARAKNAYPQGDERACINNVASSPIGWTRIDGSWRR